MAGLEEAQDWAKSLPDPTDKFSLNSIIGTGNSSVVYEALNSEEKTVAIKIQEESESMLPPIYTEFQFLTKLSGNPNFPATYGAYRNTSTVPNQIWFILELCEEGSVQLLLLKLHEKDRVLSEDIIAYILRRVILCIKDLHDLNIVHRDLKTANFLISKNGDIKLGDFGFAAYCQEKLKSVVGSPAWMAPEVVESERLAERAYDTRADVWSLGICGVELGDGSPPLAEVFPPRALFHIVQHPPPGLKRPGDWSQLFNDFISECLEKNPDHRPWLVELLEHPFIENIAEEEAPTRANFLQLLKEFRDAPLPQIGPEISVKSDFIKLERNMVGTRMWRDDLATLDSVNEDTVLETVHQRFGQGNIYTYLGDILIVINPFHEYPVYGPEVAAQYKYRARCDNAPHIYGVGDRAYQDMLHHQQTQQILLTGETGSGKTTAGKQLIWHLANMTASNRKMVERVTSVPAVMEAFGHASTVFNPNSTRHIQYFELTFTKTGKLSGGILWAYCLEKWRVTHNQQSRKQSNFHIFYYLLDTLVATDQAEKYYLEKGKIYDYLAPSPTHSPQEGVNKLREVKEAFNVLDFTSGEQETIVRILAAILILGQIRFAGDENDEDEEKSVTVVERDALERVSKLLEVDEKKLGWALTNYCLMKNGEAVRGRSTEREAAETRDSLARSLYTRLVDWIVNLINTKLSLTRLVFGDQHGLGILDIPGFECFLTDNTLDQFLVNLTNEQMQFFYNQRVFAWEMEDYVAEEFNHPTFSYHDNRELLDAVLSKPAGLLAVLDNATRAGKADPKYFLDEIKASIQTRFVRSIDEGTFTVAHYSGQVKYDARNFVERNKNFLSPEVIEVMRQSANPTIVQHFTNQMTKTGNLTISAGEEYKESLWTTSLAANHKRFNTKTRGKFSQSRQMQTIAATMRNSLLEMLQKVSQGSSHFVRCLRSNLRRKPFDFDTELVKYQLRALSVVNSIRVRQNGYSRRLRFSEFLKRYKFLAFSFDETVEETSDNCRLLLIRLKLEGWAIGQHKVMLRYYNEEFLSRLYEEQVHKVVKIQSMMRAFLARKRVNLKFQRLVEVRQEPTPVASSRSNYCNVDMVFESEPTTPVPVRRKSLTLVEPKEKQLFVEPEEELESGQRSPRQIARAFEVKMTNGSVNGHPKPGFTGRCMPPLFTPTAAQKSEPGSSTPQVINPMIEFTNAANKMFPSTGSVDEAGPFDFKGMLRKTNKSLFDLERRTTLPLSQAYGVPVNQLKVNASLKSKLSLPAKGPRTVSRDELPLTSPAPTPSPERSLTRRTSNASSINSNCHTNLGPETVHLSPGLVIEGIVEDL